MNLEALVVLVALAIPLATFEVVNDQRSNQLTAASSRPPPASTVTPPTAQLTEDQKMGRASIPPGYLIHLKCISKFIDRHDGRRDDKVEFYFRFPKEHSSLDKRSWVGQWDPDKRNWVTLKRFVEDTYDVQITKDNISVKSNFGSSGPGFFSRRKRELHINRRTADFEYYSETESHYQPLRYNGIYGSCSIGEPNYNEQNKI